MAVLGLRIKNEWSTTTSYFGPNNSVCIQTDLRRRLAIGVFKKIQNTWRYMIGNLTDYLLLTRIRRLNIHFNVNENKNMTAKEVKDSVWKKLLDLQQLHLWVFFFTLTPFFVIWFIFYIYFVSLFFFFMWKKYSSGFVEFESHFLLISTQGL